MKKIQYKSFSYKIQGIDDAQGIVKCYANKFNNVDSDGDITKPGCFTKTLQENRSRMKWLLNHNQTQLLGVPFLDGSGEDDFGLMAVNKFNMEKQIAKDTFTDYKLFADNNRTLEHSIGYEVVKDEPEMVGDMKCRALKELKLWEMSTLTGWGANSQTPLVDMKSENDPLELLALLEQMFTKNYTYSDTRKRAAEQIIKQLRSLAENEPDDSTQKVEPISELIKSINWNIRSSKN
jgi:HK97 family phage prohead protease